MIRRKSPDWAPWMIRWSYVEVSVSTFETPILCSASSDVPANSAG